jgi:hypothetical protein
MRHSVSREREVERGYIPLLSELISKKVKKQKTSKKGKAKGNERKVNDILCVNNKSMIEFVGKKE